jgi:excisionase family DNA binding protein
MVSTWATSGVEVRALQDIMTTEEVADAFGVDPKTVTRWVARGRIHSVKTPGGRHRFRRADIDRLLYFTGCDR